jgi:lysyl-tRNA synthetase class 2
MIDTIRDERIQKAEKLRAAGQNPYPSKAIRTHMNKQVVDDFSKLEGQTVTVVGRLMSWRDLGKLIFGKLRDFSGELQLFIRTENLAGVDFKLFDIGDFVEATGKVIKTKTGEISVEVSAIRVITKAIRPLPEKWSGIADPEIAFRKRYLDLIVNPEKIDRFVRKAKFWDLIRKYMKEQGFVEVETPVLESIVGGADARPFVTHMNSLDQDFYMRISTELFLKRLIGAGFEKVYTLGPNFRNEGMDDEHLPEFQDIEWYWAYADYRDNMNLLKDMFRSIAKEVWGKTKFSTRGYTFDLADEWEEIDYVKVIKDRLGIDIYTSTDEEMLKVIKENGVDLPGDTNRQRLIDNLWKTIRKTIAGPAFLINHPKFMSPLAKPMESKPDITERFQVIIGGSELGNGYSELNDPIDQLARFQEQQNARDAGDEESQMMDTDFVEMLEYGMPPTSGYGMSDRVFWFLEDVSAREGVLFPAMKVLKANTQTKIVQDSLKK